MSEGGTRAVATAAHSLSSLVWKNLRLPTVGCLRAQPHANLHGSLAVRTVCRHKGRVAWDPQTTTHTRFRDLHAGVGELALSLKRNRHHRRLRDLDEADQAAIRDCLEVVEWMLWKLGLHYRSELPLIEAAVMQVRLAFSEYMHRLVCGSLLDRWLGRMSLSFRPLRVWLFQRLHHTLTTLEAGVGALQLGAMIERDAVPPEVAREPDKIWAMVASKGCDLRHRLDRDSGRRRRGPNTRTRSWLATSCRRACDLLLLRSLGFREREMEHVLGFDHATISEWVDKCGRAERRLRAAAPSQGSAPVPLNPPRPHA